MVLKRRVLHCHVLYCLVSVRVVLPCPVLSCLVLSCLFFWGVDNNPFSYVRTFAAVSSRELREHRALERAGVGAPANVGQFAVHAFVLEACEAPRVPSVRRRPNRVRHQVIFRRQRQAQVFGTAIEPSPLVVKVLMG